MSHWVKDPLGESDARAVREPVAHAQGDAVNDGVGHAEAEALCAGLRLSSSVREGVGLGERGAVPLKEPGADALAHRVALADPVGLPLAQRDAGANEGVGEGEAQWEEDGVAALDGLAEGLLLNEAMLRDPHGEPLELAVPLISCR